MKRTTLFPLVVLALCPACIIHIDGDGWDTGSAFDYGDHDRGPRLRGNGVAARQERSTAEFDAVQISGSFDVEVEVGGPQRVEVFGDANLLEHVLTEVRGGSLEVGMERGSYSTKRDLLVRITIPDLRAAALHGSGDLSVVGVERDALAFSITGSGSLRASGAAHSVTVDCSGSGDAKLGSLAVQEAAVVVSGSSDVQINSAKRLDVSMSGSGDVRYSGHPVVTASISGSGDVKPR